MISKELLSVVLKKRPIDILRFGKETELGKEWIEAGYSKSGNIGAFNIHELAHMCKEWSYCKRYFLSTGKDIMGYFCLDRERSRSFIADTEPEAIFKACEWILKQQKENQ